MFFFTSLVAPTFTIIQFYSNQSKIIAEKCINKDKPELECNGHCYLNKTLKTYQNNINEQEENDLKPIFYSPVFVENIKSIQLNQFYTFKPKNNETHHLNHYSFLGIFDLLDPPEV